MVKLNSLKYPFLWDCRNHIFRIYWKFWELSCYQLFRIYFWNMWLEPGSWSVNWSFTTMAKAVHYKECDLRCDTHGQTECFKISNSVKLSQSYFLCLHKIWGDFLLSIIQWVLLTSTRFMICSLKLANKSLTDQL